jgi:hypothetical protein
MRTDQDLKDQLLAIGMPANIVEDFANQCGWYNCFTRLMKGEIAVVLVKETFTAANPFLTILEQKIEFQRKWLFLEKDDMRFGASIAVHGKNKRLYFVGVTQLNRSSNLVEAFWEVAK